MAHEQQDSCTTLRAVGAMTPPLRPPHHTLRLILGILLMLPVPMAALAWVIYIADDFRHTPAWLRDWMVYALPLVSVAGVAILPIRVWLRALLACLGVPVIVLILFVWAMMFACYAFNDCIKSLV